MGQINEGFTTFSGVLEASGLGMSVLSHSGQQSGGNFCTFPLSAGAGLLVPLTRHETLCKALNI